MTFALIAPCAFAAPTEWQADLGEIGVTVGCSPMLAYYNREQNIYVTNGFFHEMGAFSLYEYVSS